MLAPAAPTAYSFISMYLAAPDEPLRLPDGRTVHPSGEVTPPAMVEVPSGAEAQRLVAATRRKLTDLPAPPAAMNTINVVLTYSLSGLTNDEIALATELTVKQVGIIKMSQAYVDMEQLVVKSVLESDMQDVRSILQQGARRAAGVIVNALNADEAAVRMVAARDVLDRSGHGKTDVHEHRIRMEGGLLIEVVDRAAQPAIPTLTLTADRGLSNVASDHASPP